mmetsp:Transcript_14848/g.47370  ORF Transcript_14848/g.47370 Transcript_14848/m.47370 type:complete len:129 (-) Transcript_14848:201-587(-)
MEKTTLLYDYYGFPPATYDIKWAPPGSPSLAAEVVQLLKDQGIPCEEEGERGLDHGVFIPLSLAFPEADVPVVQLSMFSSLSAQSHLDLGAALAPLRERGVLVVGSGQMTQCGEETHPQLSTHLAAAA